MLLSSKRWPRVLSLPRKNNYWPLLVEGDSNVATQACWKLQQGCSVAKISTRWRLNRILQWIDDSIKEAKGVLFQAVRRKANNMVDYLAN